MSTEVKRQIRDCYAKISDILPNFKPRRAQNFLVAQIAQTLLKEDDAERILVAEAGTGIGKSLAYLQAGIPCALHAKKTLVISTATIALQEQLIEKDLPLYQKIAGQHFSYTLAKGRQRYCCVQRLEQAATGDYSTVDFDLLLTEKPTRYEDTILKRLWNQYQKGHWNGDRDQWDETIPDHLWQLIGAERHSCQRGLPEHNQCPFQKARQDIETHDVLVVNHALLIADLHMGGGVILPEPSKCFYIIDEAHHFPKIARDQGAFQAGLKYSLKWIENLIQFVRSTYKELIPKITTDIIEKLIAELREILTDANTVLKWVQSNTQLFEQGNVFRFPNTEFPEALSTSAENLQGTSRKALSLTDKLLTLTNESLKDGALKRKEAQMLLSKLGFYQQRLEHFQQLWHLCSLNKNSNTPVARWLERNEQDTTLHASPIEAGNWLHNNLWQQAHGVILVSATLTALNSFDYYKRQAGLHYVKEFPCLRLSSPFDYQKSQLHVPKMPCDPSQDGFTEALAEKIEALIEDKHAHLVLFSSYHQMHQVFDILSKKIDTPIFMQGQKARNTLLDEYKTYCNKQHSSVLFGTGSFTEGLDLPGHYLTRLIITKLPFAVPTSPIEESTAEWIEQQGQNPFMQMTVPEASRKLIQACGRLIRQENDQGKIYLLDRRIITRRYGAAMLQALPPFTHEIES